MRVETEAIVLKQTKAANGRKMITLLSRNYGKISAGSSYGPRGKAALATRPFTRARYQIYKNRDSYNIDRAEVIKSYYAIGEDIEKYIRAAYALELADKLIEEEQPVPEVYELMSTFFSLMEKRNKDQDTLLFAFQMKLLDRLGYCPDMDGIGEEENEASVVLDVDGGRFLEVSGNEYNDGGNSRLILEVSFGIVSVLRYFVRNPLERLEKLALEPEMAAGIREVLRTYIKYHLQIDRLKSEELL